MKIVALLLLLMASAPAAAHAGHTHEAPGWTLDLSVTGPLMLALVIYVAGFVRLWARSTRGRPVLRNQAILYALGWLSLVIALVSPLHQAGERSFAFHMVEHEIIMLISALLLVASRSGPALLWAFPAAARATLGRLGSWNLWRKLADPVVATAVQGAAIWAWHAPGLFNMALHDEGWHVVQHLSFLVSALFFWWAMVHGRSRGAHVTAAVCLFVTSMVGGGLGALMALSNSPWYRDYAMLEMTPWGLTPEQDQQVAGLIMWVPGGLFHLAAALWFMLRALRENEVSHAASPL